MTYLAPSILQAFFEAIVEHVRQALGQRASLSVESRVSGPEKGADDPFSEGVADVGFMCAPSFYWLRELEGSPVELVGAAPVFRDVRALGQPVYFSEVVVHCANPAQSFAELRGCSWAYNDPCSLSGYFNLLKKLADMGEDERFFRRLFCSGSHLNSIELIVRKEVDAAAIDSNALRIILQSSPELRNQLRVLGSWGPFPIQPVVVRSDLSSDLKARLRAALLAINPGAGVPPALTVFRLERFASVTYKLYAPEERVLLECELGIRQR